MQSVHADVISSVYVPLLMQHEAQALSNIGAEQELKLEAIKSSLQRTFWPAIALSIKDSHAMEKWVEAVLKEMATKKVSDWQAYCILWMTFGSLLPKHTLTRYVQKSRKNRLKDYLEDMLHSCIRPALKNINFLRSLKGLVCLISFRQQLLTYGLTLV